jgi:hypothetical protein
VTINLAQNLLSLHKNKLCDKEQQTNAHPSVQSEITCFVLFGDIQFKHKIYILLMYENSFAV